MLAIVYDLLHFILIYDTVVLKLVISATQGQALCLESNGLRLAVFKLFIGYLVIN